MDKAQPSDPASPVPWYPVLLDFSGRDCLVVGGGAIGARKAEALLAAGAIVTLVANEVGPEAHRLAESGNLSIVTRAYEPSDLDGKWYVVTAIDDPRVTAQIKLDADARRIWMNAADDPPNCSVILPAVHRDGDVIVAISTAGASPATAGWLRDRVVKEFGVLPGRLAAEVRVVREQVREFRSSEGMLWTALVGELADALAVAAESNADDSNHTPSRAVNDAVESWLGANCRPDGCRSCTTECLALSEWLNQ